MAILTYKTFACLPILVIVGCNSEKTHNNINDTQKELRPIFGLYSYYLALGEGADCESLKRSLQLNEDSTFIMKEYCNDNYMSSFQPIIKTGIFRMQSPGLLNFSSSDNTQFKIKLLNDSTLEITPRIDGTYPFQKDTTRNEKI